MLKNRLLHLCKLLIIGILGLLIMHPQPVDAAGERLGGMNLNGYCRSLNRGDATVVTNNWQCSTGQAIVMDQACVWQYPNQSAVSGQTRTNDPYSWACYAEFAPGQNQPTPSTGSGPTATPTPTTAPATNGTRLGGMNLYDYCQSRGQGGSELQGNTWTCATGGAINLDQACVWQYTQPSNARQDAAGNPYTWACYAGSSTGITPTPTQAPTATPTPSVSGSRLGGMNLYDYCQSRGQGGSELQGNTWTCATGTAINLDQACVWQYTQPSNARQDAAGNPYTWACYAGGTTNPTPIVTVTPSVTPTVTPTPTNRTTYLSLGDSFAFGFHLAQFQQAEANGTYDPDLFNDGFDRSFYNNLQGITTNVSEVNYACPGETTATFVNGGCAFNNGRELHDEYATTQSQLQAAINYISARPNENMVVTLSLGVNDIIALADQCQAQANPQTCYQAQTPGVLQTLQQNVDRILDSLQQASQRIQIVLMKEPDPVFYAGSENAVNGLNNLLDREAIARSLPIADTYNLFTEQNICSMTNYCSTPQDFHPNAAGYSAMANTIWNAYRSN